MIPITATFKSLETRHFHVVELDVDKLTENGVLASLRKKYPREPSNSFKVIKLKYGVPCFRTWAKVPSKFHSRTSAAKAGVVIPADAKPDAIKNASSQISKDRIYFLYDISKYLK